MKKVIIGLVSAVMVSSMSVSAFAAEGSSLSNRNSYSYSLKQDCKVYFNKFCQNGSNSWSNTTGGNNGSSDNNSGNNSNGSVSKPEGNENNSNISVSAYAQEVLNLVNKERSANGLSPLSFDTKVQKAADTRAEEIKKSFSHTRPDGKTFSTALTEAGASFNGAGENIAIGQKTPEEVVSAWMNSSGHRANILNSKYKYIGIGCVKSGSGYAWTQLFTY